MMWVFVVQRWEYLEETYSNGRHQFCNLRFDSVWKTRDDALLYVAKKKPPTFSDGQPRFSYQVNRVKLKELK